ncbi:MAG TPA: MBL fold metallo-hydrolase [Candidatus Saccharimonadales bacterium]|nr:MBL fold metallo-hydrolase [Candidatus Saccharimonadales bacterium]
MQQTTFEGAIITALGHDGFLVEFPNENLTLAFDPFQIAPIDKKADYIFVSHGHFDHCDPDSIRKLSHEKTVIVASNAFQNELAEFGDKVAFYDGTDKVKLEKITYWAIPAYNVNKFRTPTEVFHPKELGGVGFIVEVGSTRIYHAGDTDVTPEMETLKKIDVALLPISGTYVMTVEEAVQAAELIQPKLAIPMHFGKLLGSVMDAHRFRDLLKDKIAVTVLTAE